MKSHNAKPRHPQLWLGYGLILAVILLGVTAITAQFQHADMRRVAARQSHAIADLRDARQADRRRIVALQDQNRAQDQSLAIDRADLGRQQQAIGRLARLRTLDWRAITALHNELAVRRIHDAAVRDRIKQLETSNAAARATIHAAGGAKP